MSRPPIDFKQIVQNTSIRSDCSCIHEHEVYIYNTFFEVFPSAKSFVTHGYEKYFTEELVELIRKDGKPVGEYFINKFSSEVLDEEDLEVDDIGDEKRTWEGSGLYVYQDLLVLIYAHGYGSFAIVCHSQSADKHLDFYFKLEDFVYKPTPPEPAPRTVGILVNSPQLHVRQIALEQEDIDIALNYGQDFAENHYENIRTTLEESKKGIVMFHSDPGMGKTHIIKHLIGKVKKSFVYIPTSCVGMLDTPEFVTILMDNPNSIFILEDAEKAIVKRDSQNENSSLVSSILNLSDGIYGSLFNVSFIITYNTHREYIDDAILRPGRLLYSHYFKKLSVVETNRLRRHLGKEDFDRESSLAEIYNM